MNNLQIKQGANGAWFIYELNKVLLGSHDKSLIEKIYTILKRVSKVESCKHKYSHYTNENNETVAICEKCLDLHLHFKTDENNVLADGLSLIQAKDIAMREGKKIKHCSFMDDEYIYYKNGCWFTQDDYQMPEVCFLNDQEQGWWNDSWSVLS